MPDTPKQAPPTHGLPLSPPSARKAEPRKKGAPDLRIEEIEEKHIPKDRNVFDK